MSVVLLSIAALFCLKILWNFIVPYELAIRAIKSRGQEGGGISLSLEVEIALWLLLVLISFVSTSPTWPDKPKNVIAWGLVAIIASYIHLFVGGVIAGWLAKEITKKRIR